MKVLIRLGIALFLVAAVAVGATIFYLDSIATTAIEEGGTYALGVETRLGGTRIGLLSGRLGLRNLEIANPPGFEHDFLRLGSGESKLDTDTIGDDTIVISNLTFEDIEVSLLKNSAGRFNYEIILDHAAALGEESSAGEESGEAGTKVVIRELVLRNITAQIDLFPGLGKFDDLSLHVPEVKLTNLGESDGGVSVSEAITLITTAVLEAVAAKSGSLPGQVGEKLAGLTGDLDRIQAKLGEALPVARSLGGTATEEAGKLGKAASELVEGIGGLFGGKKDD